MAKVSVSVHSITAAHPNGDAAPVTDPPVQQAVVDSSTAAALAGLVVAATARNMILRIVPLADVHVEVGASPTATASSMIIPAGQVYECAALPSAQVSVLNA